MMKRAFIWLGLAACAALLGFSVHELFLIRFQRGDVYPPYSTLRTDPLGTKVWFEALGDLPGVAVRRNFSPQLELPHLRGATLWVVGAGDGTGLTKSDAAEIESFLRFGGRVIIAFEPVLHDPIKTDTPDRKEPKADASPSPQPDDPPEPDPGTMSLDDLLEKWGAKVAHAGVPRPDADQPAPALSAKLVPDLVDLEPELTWHSSLVFELTPETWVPIYLRAQKPVLARRSFGAGEIILVGDAFLLSNEALRTARAPRLLNWLADADAAPVMIFDETLHGVVQQDGVANLARKYRLEAPAAALLVLAILFIWKNAAAFNPAPPPPRGETLTITGREASAGLVNLLRRHLTPRELFATAVAEWRRSFGAQAPDLARQLEQVAEPGDQKSTRTLDKLARWSQASDRLRADQSWKKTPFV